VYSIACITGWWCWRIKALIRTYNAGSLCDAAHAVVVHSSRYSKLVANVSECPKMREMKKRHTVKSEMFSRGLNFRCLRNGLGFFGLLACRGRKLARWNSSLLSFLHSHRDNKIPDTKGWSNLVNCIFSGGRVSAWGLGNIRLATSRLH